MQSGPLVPYYGGKWRVTPWILQHMPPHRAYVEPFGGVASVLLCKPPAFTEVYNDLNRYVVSLFRVLRTPHLCAELVDRVELTPYSREEYEQAWYTKDSPDDSIVDIAWKFIVFAYQGTGATSTSDRTSLSGWENRIYSAGRLSCNKDRGRTWAGYPKRLVEAAHRLRSVAVEHRDAFDIIKNYAGTPESDTLFYLDPPYLDVKGYPNTPFTREHHERLIDTVTALDCMVMLSGYDSPLYQDRLKDWTVYRRASTALNNKDTIECLWLNPLAEKNLELHGSVYKAW